MKLNSQQKTAATNPFIATALTCFTDNHLPDDHRVGKLAVPLFQTPGTNTEGY